MKIGHKHRRGIDIADSGALSDLAFLLIIFFIVIAVFNVNTGFLLGLPLKDSVKTINQSDLIRVRLDEQGTLWSDGESLSEEAFSKRVDERIAARPNMTLLLEIDPETPYQSVVDVIDLTRRMRVDNFSFTMSEIGE